MAAAESSLDVRRLPVRRSPKNAAGGSRTPGFEAFRVPVQRTKSVQNAGECPLFLKSHSATRTTLQMCTETFQFLTAEFIVEIMQDVNSIIAGVHSEASRALIVRTSQSRTPSIQDYSLGHGHSISRCASCTDSSHRSAECDFLEWTGIPLMGCQVSPDRLGCVGVACWTCADSRSVRQLSD
jgi:hypothetical protein